MSTGRQIPPVLLARATGLLLSGRVHFPQDSLGQVVSEPDEAFIVFRKVVLDRSGGRSETTGAQLRVRFRFARFSARTNRVLSGVIVPFIVAQPGFRSKTWMLGETTGAFQGVYEFDSIQDVEHYRTSFPMKLMRRRAIEGSLSCEIQPLEAGARSGPGESKENRQ